MRIIVHKNTDPNFPVDVSIVAESELTPIETQLANIPVELEPKIIDDSELPPDRSYIRAWELNNGVVSVNINKAKEIKKNRLRWDRAKPLSELDIAFQRALETNSDTTAIVAEKQRLRDITNLVDGVTSLEELDKINI